jgi:hypothetical protein
MSNAIWTIGYNSWDPGVNPMWGYKVIVFMALEMARNDLNRNSWYDNTIANDHRMLELDYQLPIVDMAGWYDFFMKTAIGRAQEITLKLGVEPLGFFPGGPDYDDVGDFKLKLLSFKDTTTRKSPKGYMTVNMKFVITELPAAPVPFPALVPRGTYFIDTVTGLLPPQEEVDIESIWGNDVGTTYDGECHQIDLGEDADACDSTIKLMECRENMANVVHHLTEHVRGNAFELCNVYHHYPFGIRNYGNGMVMAYLNSRKIEIVHEKIHDFHLSMEVNFKE